MVVYCRVYNIGIEVRQGRGRYCETNIVTFTPRYQLDNQSSHKLAYAQRHIALQPVSTLYITLLQPVNVRSETVYIVEICVILLTYMAHW